MPWHVEEKGSEFCVIKDGGGEVACHPSKEAANKHMAALYANENADLAANVLVENGLSEEAAKELVAELLQDLNSFSEGTKKTASEELADWLLERLPDGITDESAETIREALEQALEETSGGSSVTDKNYTDADLSAAVEAAIAPLQAKIDEFEAANNDAETQRKLDELAAEKDAKIEELNTALDAKEVELTAAKEAVEAFEAEKADFEAAVEADTKIKEEAARLAEVKEERIAAVKEVTTHLPEERIEENAERWAKMADEDFEALLETYKDAEEIASKGKPVGAPAKTKLAGTENGDEEASTSSLSNIHVLRRAGVRDASRLGR